MNRTQNGRVSNPTINARRKGSMKKYPIKLKLIITLVVLFVFAILALRGDITAENVVIITGTVIAFYFGSENSSNGGEK